MKSIRQPVPLKTEVVCTSYESKWMFITNVILKKWTYYVLNIKAATNAHTLNYQIYGLEMPYIIFYFNRNTV